MIYKEGINEIRNRSKWNQTMKQTILSKTKENDMNKAFDNFLKELNNKFGSGYIAKDVWGYTYIYKTKPYYHPTKEGWCGDEEFYEPGYWEGDRLVPESYENKINQAYKEQYGENAPVGKEGIWSF